MIDRIYLIIRNRNDAILGMAKTRKDAKTIKTEEEQRIAEEYGFKNAQQAKKYHGDLTTTEKWEYDVTDNRYYMKGEIEP